MTTTPPRAPSARRRRPWRIVVSVAIAAALLVGVLPQFADLSEVWATVRRMTVLESTTLLAAAAWNIVTYQFVMMAALPGLRMRDAFLTGQLSTAIANTAPAGAVLGVGVTYSTLRGMGHGSRAIAIAAAVSGVWNTFVKLGLPVVALAWLSFEGHGGAALTSAAVVGLAVLVVTLVAGAAALWSEGLARRVGDAAARAVSALRGVVGRPPVTGYGERLARFQRDSHTLLRRRWVALTATTLVSHLSLYLVLLLTLRHAGVGRELVTDAEAMGAFAVVRLATALPITPGGLGVVELGLAAALTLAGGPEAPVVASVLVYRALTYALQLPLGAASGLVLRRHRHRMA